MLTQATQDKIHATAQSLGLYVYDIDFLKEDNRHILRISITRKAPMQHLSSKDEHAISLQDCQNLSELLSPMLDVEGVNLETYSLEVSSPGLERLLKKPRHYELSLGESVSVRLLDKSEIIGILEAFDNECINIKDESKTHTIPLSEVKKAKVIFEF